MDEKLLTDLGLKNIDALKVFLKEENTSQLNKWGIQTRTPSEWLMFLGEEFGELCKAVAEHQFRDGNKWEVFSEAIQVATLSLKIAEMYYFFGEKQALKKQMEDPNGRM